MELVRHLSKVNFFRQLFIVGAVGIFLMGCNYNSGVPSNAIDITPPKPAAETDPQQPQTLNFNVVLKNVFASKCLNCHAVATGNKDGVNLETYESTIALIDKVRSEIIGRSMPRRPGPALTDEEFKMVIDWIDSGANR